MTAQPHVLDFYTRPATMTSAGRHAPALDGLPRGVAALAGVVQGLLLHEHWARAYGVTLPDERRSEAHLRPVNRMLDRLLARDRRPLAVARPLGDRLVGNCRHFSVLLVALLRAQGVPARARCGFATYFVPGNFEDHWVGEYWNAAEARWVRVDAQIDALQREVLKPDFDPCDVPHDRFLTGGEAWALCRTGEADPERFGFSGLEMGGLWFVAGDLVRDAAALNNAEMLPWDVWGAMPGPGDPLDDDRLRFLDRVAELTRSPDASFAALRSLYESDNRLRVPASVFNAARGHSETV